MCVLGRRTIRVLPLLTLSLAARAVSGRGQRVVHGREAGEVDAGLVWPEAEELRRAFSWAIAGWASLNDS